MSKHAGATTGRLRVVLTPNRDDVLDAALLAGLMALALVGFRTTYSGSLYLLAGLAGTALGLVIAHLANVLRQPVIAVVAMTLAVFFLAGGAIALRSTAVAGVLPSGSTFHGLADESVHGWKELLTTLPPVDGSGPLLVLPYLLGVLGGVGGFCLARRTRPSAAPVAAPFAVLVAVIVLGTQTPAARLLQGAVFGIVALGWTALRSQRRRAPLQNGSGRVARVSTVAALLAAAFGGAALLGPHVPGVHSHSRTVLRSYVTPPFDVGQYPSPLAGYRKYTKPAHELYNTPLFTISGLPAGTSVRIATLDDYDLLTWTAANRPGAPQTPADTFQRVGTEIPDPAHGQVVTFTVTIDAGYRDVWLPGAGALTELRFSGTHASSHAGYFRYNLSTGTGVVPDRLVAGDRYTAHAVLPRVATLRPGDAVATSGGAVDAAQFLRTQAEQWAGKSSDTTARVLALAAHLHDVGKFSDGEPPNQQYLPGHSQARLLDFVNGAQIVGDDEQYAAAFALMVNDLGTPARVVLGAAPGRSGVVKGADVHAWVEVQLTDGTWRAIPTDMLMNRQSHPNKQPPQKDQKSSGTVVPPPARGKPRTELADAGDTASRVRNDQHHHAPAADGFRLPGWLLALGKWGGPPILFVVALCAAIIGAKVVRRRRRRTRGSPATRMARGWTEIVDHARDLGAVVPRSRTRREQAALLTVHDLERLARTADGHVFGPALPGDSDARAYWSQVEDARRQMSRAVTRLRRLRAALSLTSLRRPRDPAGELA